MDGGCNTCKHGWGEENCRGCLWDGKSRTNTHWEQKEPFINKPCVSGQVCHEDKMKVLEKIKAEISYYKDEEIIHAERNEMIDIILEIIDKYMKEGDAE